MLFQLGLIVLVLYVGALVAHRFKQSSVPVFILAGLGLQFFIAHSDVIGLLAQLGAMLLLFTIGLDFSPERIRRSGRTLLGATLIDVLINVPVGILVGLVLGFDLLGALILGGVLYNNSTSLIARFLIDFKRTALPETEYAVGISVLQDLVTALYLAVIASLLHADGVRVLDGVLAFTKTVGFFGGALVAAVVLRPVLERLLAHESIEVFLFFVFAFVLVLAAIAEWLGVSAALGAFLAGFILPEREFRERLDQVISPFRDLFAAIFFVSFGLLFDMADVGRVLVMSVLVIGAALGGKLLTAWVIGQLGHLSRRATLRLGVALLPRGEFSVLLAGLAPAEMSILPVTIVTVFVLALGVPLLMKWAK